jgi:hypothetical protein
METGAQQKSGHKSRAASQFLIVGLVRNCANTVIADVARLQAAMAHTSQLHWLLIESDSTDSTLGALAELHKGIANFQFKSLGKLATQLPMRTQRIARCRNEYVTEIRQSHSYKDIDYVIVADFDGLNTHITPNAIASCWERADWDMCAANQRGPYYDILALRHKYWSPNDCWAQYDFMRAYKPDKEENLSSSVYSRMIRLPAASNWIEVDSAFGGLAIYKKELFHTAAYAGMTDDGEECCEHVPFHSELKRHGARLFINPRLINAQYTEHTQALRFSKAAVRKTKAALKRTLRALIGLTSAGNQIPR